MHIGFLTPEYPHSQATPSGGLGTSIKNLASSLIAKNLKVTVFVYGQKQDLNFEEKGISFHFIKKREYRLLGWYRYRKYLQKALNKEIAIEKIDVIEAPDWTGITALMHLYCPLVIRMHGSDAYFCSLEGRKQKSKNFLFEKLALKSANALISVSAFTAEKTKEIFGLKRDITVIPNSIETALFPPSEKFPTRNRLLYFGTIIRKKGVLELAAIFNEVVKKKAETELWMIGKDVVDIFENSSTLKIFQKRLSPQAKQQLKYLPEVSYSAIKDRLDEAAVIVLPSFAEALPMSWLEAMSMEKAMVTSNIGWAKEMMIDGITGYTEDPKNHKNYADKILHLLENPEVAKAMGKAARQQVLKKFSTEVVVQKNISLYEGLVRE